MGRSSQTASSSQLSALVPARTGRHDAVVKTTIAILAAALLASICFGWSQSRQRAQAVAAATHAGADAKRAEAARAAAQAKLGAYDRMFSAGNATIAGRPDVSFRDALASGAERIGDLPAAARASALFALAEARRNIGDIEASLVGYQEAATAAREANDVRTRLRAQLRRSELLQQHVSHREFVAAYDELAADPALAGDALVHAANLLLGADDARWLGHVAVGDERADRALALWPVPEADGDEVLRAELESRVLIEQARRGAGDAAAARERVERMREAANRLRATLGDEHLALVALRACADLSTGGALAGLLDQTRRAAIDHGAGHPAVQARIDVLLDRGAARSDAGSRAAIEQLALQSARAVPLGDRWRARTIAAVLATNDALVEPITPEEVVELGRMRCRDAPDGDPDCLEGRQAAAQAMVFANRLREAVAILRAALAELPADADAARVSALNAQLQRALSRG